MNVNSLIGLAIFAFILFGCAEAANRGTKCDPKEFTKRSDPDNRSSYFYCNTDGTLAKRDCPQGKQFNKRTLRCDFPHASVADKPTPATDPILMPQYQAPDDICGGGMPLTRLSAPVACNPSISSCPDGYVCTLHARTGTSYCCQSHVETTQDTVLCAGNQVTYFEPLTGLPKTCVLSSSSSTCPTGFGCNLVSGSLTRCCGKDFGCPLNSAGYVNPSTGGHVQCNIADPTSCPNGFVCIPSAMFSTGVCCSDTSNSPNDVCGGDAPLAKPNPCSASTPCPAGYNCRNGRCCPAKGLCPAGMPLGGVTSCSASNPCPNNYQCATNNGQQYCCPAPEHVCGQPRDAGVPCETRVSAVARYYFDVSTGSCRSFHYSQCGGNANNFDTLEQCEGFCLESQCPQGAGLRAGPSIATCTLGSADSCPSQYSCVQPLFGTSHICCTSPEQVCRETVTAGTACYGPFMTIQRFHFNAEKGQCESFQFYGCSSSGNNFGSKKDCENICQPSVKNVCNGVAPLNDEGDYLQRCSENVPCPKNSWCNARGYCCPSPEAACNAPKSIGHTCLSQRPGTYWYYDTASEICMPFTYSGCGGTPNRFADRESCEQMCINKVGECPRGMAPYLTVAGTKRCTLNVAGSCPDGSSCVLSNTGEPICCSSTAQCPKSRTPYVIPGSDSHVACLPDDDNCPQGYQCVQSSTVQGFYMCCSGTSRRSTSQMSKLAKSPLPTDKFASQPKCPMDLTTNGQRCVVNEIEGCPAGYACIGRGPRGVCCRAQPKCSRRGRKPFYLANKQVMTCGEDEASCPRGSVCTASTIEGVDICCVRSTLASVTTFSRVPKVVPKCKDGALPFFALGSRVPQACTADRDDECPEEYECEQASDEQFYCCPAWDRCPAGATPFLIEGSRKPLGCNWMANNCPEGYSCEGSKDRAICCRSRPQTAQCPLGRSPFLYAKRPLVCPPGKKSCPSGFDCVSSRGGSVHICCSSIDLHTPECVSGYAYTDPSTSKNQLCDPASTTCPPGYSCKRSTLANAYVCCTAQMDNRYEGYCPPGQVPWTGVNSVDPPTCHMALNPCPTTAAYQCVYSAEKQNSYCCAPVDTTPRHTFNHYRSNNGHNGQQTNQIQAMPPKGLTSNEMTFLLTNVQPNPATQFNSFAGYPTNPVDASMSASNENWAAAAAYAPNSAYTAFGAQAAGQVSMLPGMVVPTCPPWSRPLLNPVTKDSQSCSTWNKCPTGFTCYSNYPDGRNAQCCTTVPLDNQVVFRAQPQFAASPSAQPQNEPTQTTASTASPKSTIIGLPVNVTLIRCPPGTLNISGICKRMYFVGQQGCDTNDQCSKRTNGTFCFKGYCSCADNKLIHESKCVTQCPEGFLNIAGRCHDLTTVVFMDSVDERANGTIGGFCRETVVREEQCLVPNAYCNERSITCQCLPGFELKMDFDKKDDKGSCIAVEDSKYKDGPPKKSDAFADSPADLMGMVPQAFYVIESQQDAASPSTNSTRSVERTTKPSVITTVSPKL